MMLFNKTIFILKAHYDMIFRTNNEKIWSFETDKLYLKACAQREIKVILIMSNSKPVKDAIFHFGVIWFSILSYNTLKS